MKSCPRGARRGMRERFPNCRRRLQASRRLSRTSRRSSIPSAIRTPSRSSRRRSVRSRSRRTRTSQRTSSRNCGSASTTRRRTPWIFRARNNGRLFALAKSLVPPGSPSGKYHEMVFSRRCPRYFYAYYDIIR